MLRENRKRRLLVPEGACEEWVQLHAGRMRYLKAGSGPPLVLVHGLMGFSFSWSENIPPLADVRTVYAIDLLNLGYSDRCNIDASLKATAAQVLEFMDAVGLDRAELVGSSNGGSIVLATTVQGMVERMLVAGMKRGPAGPSTSTPVTLPLA